MFRIVTKILSKVKLDSGSLKCPFQINRTVLLWNYELSAKSSYEGYEWQNIFFLKKEKKPPKNLETQEILNHQLLF